MPSSVLIQYDECRLTLNLPLFFEDSPVINIRKLFKLLESRPYQNEPALEALDQFFPEWEQDLAAQLNCASTELKIAESGVHDIRRKVGLFGTCATKEMRKEHSQKSRAYLTAQRKLKNAKAALERSGKVFNAYTQIIK